LEGVNQSGLPLTCLSGLVRQLERYELRLNGAADNEVSILGLCEQSYNLFIVKSFSSLVDFKLVYCNYVLQEFTFRL